MIPENFREMIANFIYPEGREQRNHLFRQVNMDSLTGLANRAAYDKALKTATLDAETSFIVFDMNNFGQINKHPNLGHEVGDMILKDAAKIIYDVASYHGYGTRCFRYGGDEFVVLVPKSIANTVRNKIEALFGVRSFEGIKVSLSGVYAQSFAAADSQLQARKQTHKLEFNQAKCK